MTEFDPAYRSQSNLFTYEKLLFSKFLAEVTENYYLLRPAFFAGVSISVFCTPQATRNAGVKLGFRVITR